MRGAWWVVTHAHGKRTKKRIGPTKADKRQAEEISQKINAALALGTLPPQGERWEALRCDVELRRWHRAYAPTMTRSYELLTKGLIRNHLFHTSARRTSGRFERPTCLRLSTGSSRKASRR
jgi:hypothetical protein